MISDSAVFTPSGRRLLESLGVLEPDPLLGAAQEWLAGHQGPQTPAVRHVRAALAATLPPADVLQEIARFKATPWK